MRTISHRWPERIGMDASAQCDICGVMWPRSRMKRKRDGLLYCPDDVAEQDKVTLSEANAAGAKRHSPEGRAHIGSTDTLDGSTLDSVHYTNAGTTDDATVEQTVAGDSFLP